MPAVMSLLGRPRLVAAALADRVLPNVDIEGEGLRAHLDKQPVKV